MTSRTAGVCSLLVVAALLGTAQPARADWNYQSTTAVVAGAVFGAVDLGFIIYDVTMSERGQPPGKALVWTELPLMTLQMASGISMVASALQADARLHDLGIERDLYLPIGALLITVAAPLFAHAVRHGSDRVGSGIHTSREPSPLARRLPLLLPTQVGDAHAGGPGLMLAGRF